MVVGQYVLGMFSGKMIFPMRKLRNVIGFTVLFWLVDYLFVRYLINMLPYFIKRGKWYKTNNLTSLNIDISMIKTSLKMFLFWLLISNHDYRSIIVRCWRFRALVLWGLLFGVQMIPEGSQGPLKQLGTSWDSADKLKVEKKGYTQKNNVQAFQNMRVITIYVRCTIIVKVM